MKRAQSLKLGAIAQTLPIVFGYGANLLATPYVVWSLGLANFGLWSLTGALAQYGVLLDLGISRAITRYVALYHAQEDRLKERAIIGGCVMVIIILGCVLACAAVLLPAQLGSVIGTDDANLVRELFMTSIVVLTTGLLSSILSGASIGRGRVVAVNIGVAAQRASVVLGGVVAIIFNPTLSDFAVGSAIGGVIGLCLVILAVLIDEHEIVIGKPRVSVLRELIGFSIKGQVMAVSDIVLFQSGKVLAGILIGPAAAGAYELGSRLALGARAVGSSAVAVLGAHLTRAYTQEGAAKIIHDYPRLVQRNAIVSNFLLLLLTATSFSAVTVWLGTANLEVVYVVVGLTLAFTVNVSTGVTLAIAFALNQVGIVSIVAVLGSIVTIALALPLAYIGGLDGILIGMAVGIIFSSLLGVIAIHRVNEMPMSMFFKPLLGPFLVGAISTTLAIPAGIIYTPLDRSSALVSFAASAVIFCMVYMTLGWRLKYLPAVHGLARGRLGRKSTPIKES